MLRLDSLAPLYPVDPEVGLGEFERRIMGEPFEVAGVFGADGRLVLAPKGGSAGSVDFIEEEAPYLQGTVVTHNHPFASPFSAEDAILASSRDLAELRAVCPDGTVYSLVRPSRGWPEHESMALVVDEAIRAHLRETAVRNAKGLSTMKERERSVGMFSHEREGFAKIGVRLERGNVWQR